MSKFILINKSSALFELQSTEPL